MPSKNHPTQNCDVFSSDESRKEVADSKNCCSQCLEEKLDSNGHWRCYENKRCYNCFMSDDHNTLYCPQKHVKNLFIPKIDQVLIGRFIQTFNPIESYQIAFSSQEALDVVLLKNCKVLKEYIPGLSIRSKLWDDKTILIVKGSIDFDPSKSGEELTQKFSNAIKSKTIIVESASTVRFRKCIIAADFFLQFLSPNLGYLTCQDMELKSPVTLAQILEKTTKIRHLDIRGAKNIVIENSWPNDLLKYRSSSHLKKLGYGEERFSNDGESSYIFDIDNFDFDFKALESFIEIKSDGENVIIHLDYYAKNASTIPTQKFLQYFIPFPAGVHDDAYLSSLSVKCMNSNTNESYTLRCNSYYNERSNSPGYSYC